VLYCTRGSFVSGAVVAGRCTRSVSRRKRGEGQNVAPALRERSQFRWRTSFRPAFVTAHGGTVASAEAFLFSSMAAGQSYINIHTDQFGGGEIRGQLNPVPAPPAVVLAGLGPFGSAATGLTPSSPVNESSRETRVLFTAVGWGRREVYTRSKWERMTAGRPIYYILPKDDISSWDEAERIARSPDRRPRVRVAGDDAARWPFLTTKAPNGGRAP